MSAISNQPTSQNFLSPVHFDFQIKKCPALSFFAQRVRIPAINLPPAIEPTPFTHIPATGDHITWAPLEVDFKVDEALQNWFEIFNWMTGLGFPEDYDEYKALQDSPKILATGIKSDISIFILDSSKNPKFNCIVKDAFPTGLSQMQLNSDVGDIDFMMCTATFSYTNYVMSTIV